MMVALKINIFNLYIEALSGKKSKLLQGLINKMEK